MARTVSPLARFHLREAFLQSGVFGPRGTMPSRSRRSFETGSCQAEQGKQPPARYRSRLTSWTSCELSALSLVACGAAGLSAGIPVPGPHSGLTLPGRPPAASVGDAVVTVAVAAGGGAVAHQHKILLDESEMPTRWYNVIPHLPSPPPPPLHPGTLQPVGPDDLAPLFPMDLILQEVTQDRYVDIPDEVPDIYRLFSPSPSSTARTASSERWAPRRGVSTSTRGSRRPARTSRTPPFPQAFYNARSGNPPSPRRRPARAAGTALAFACGVYGLAAEVWQVGASYDWDYRRSVMETFEAMAIRSPSDLTELGRKILADDPTIPAASASRSARPSRPRPRTSRRHDALGSPATWLRTLPSA